MHITIIGAGIIGCLTAYYLRQDGHEITLIDKNAHAGDEATSANAGQLSYTDLPPLGSPQLWKQLPKIALGLHPRISIEHYFDRDLWRFAYLLLSRESNAAAFKKNHERLLAYGQHSRQLMDHFITETNLAFDHQKLGRIALYDNQHDFDKRIHFCQALQQTHKFPFDILSAQACRQKIPAIKDRKGPAIAGGLYLPENDLGDSAMLCRQLVDHIFVNDPKITCRFNQDVTEIQHHNNAITGIKTSTETITSDHYILCAGAWAVNLLKPMGIDLPIYPIRGYNITMPKPASLHLPHSLTDLGHQIVFTPLGKRLRASMGFEMAGFDKKMPQKSYRMIEHTMNKVFPKLDLREAEIRTGFRPFTPNSLPITKRSQRYQNLTCHIGHGMYGWTLAHSCAYQVAKSLKS